MTALLPARWLKGGFDRGCRGIHIGNHFDQSIWTGLATPFRNPKGNPHPSDEDEEEFWRDIPDKKLPTKDVTLRQVWENRTANG